MRFTGFVFRKQGVKNDPQVMVMNITPLKLAFWLSLRNKGFSILSSDFF